MIKPSPKILFILYVADQARSKEFYQTVLSITPSLDVPGMTEFDLGGSCKLGLMPEKGIAKILGPSLPDPAAGRGIPRCELYLTVDDPQKYCDRALACGARLVSPLAPRNWGDQAVYLSDPDGHIIAFARKLARNG
jgi:catechol 2,3-dioxygenase-like lactoylglutathione lyase family enzyme